MIRVVIEDLALLAADAVVRPATTRLVAVSPASHRLDSVGGESFSGQRQLQDALDVGAAVVTGAGALNAELVIHAVVARDQEPVTADAVRRALTSTMHRAEQFELNHVALPPLGVGPTGLPLEQVAELMEQVLTAHLQAHAFPTDISIVVENDNERSVFARHVRRAGDAS